MDEASTLKPEEINQIMRSLLHKEGTWVDWGKNCQILNKAGCSSQQIFEETGFQASHQNLIVVAMQVYDSLVRQEASEEILQYYRGPKSDILYELRILDYENRLAVAEIAKEKSLEIEDTQELAKAFQEFCRIHQLPVGFTKNPGDALAYQCWRRARQKKDLQERSRLIAKGLKFAHSPSARSLLEQLLTDFATIPIKSAPLLPIYRLEETEEMSRIVPLLGFWPFSPETLASVPIVTATDPFKIVEISSSGSFISLPGWNALIKAEDPVAFLTISEKLPRPTSNKSETVLVVVDRALTTWDANGYFLTKVGENLDLVWYPENPKIPMFAKLLLILRPKNILDEENIVQPWQMDD